MAAPETHPTIGLGAFAWSVRPARAWEGSPGLILSSLSSLVAAGSLG
jgi:hypothetical protein